MAAQSRLPSRYEIRKLLPEHSDLAGAIEAHSNIFASPIWSLTFPEAQTARCLAYFHSAKYLVGYQIETGHSYGIFDKEYQYKRPESLASGGKLHWDTNHETASAGQLLDQMDFPLVSVALAYDSFDPPDPDQILDFMEEVVPGMEILYTALALEDGRDPESWRPSSPGQVLLRNATATRMDTESRGLMKALSSHTMRAAADRGFRAIQIDCAHDAVRHVWTSPPAPFKAEVVSEVNCYHLEEEGEDGEEMNYPTRPSVQDVTRVYLRLE